MEELHKRLSDDKNFERFVKVLSDATENAGSCGGGSGGGGGDCGSCQVG